MSNVPQLQMGNGGTEIHPGWDWERGSGGPAELCKTGTTTLN